MRKLLAIVAGLLAWEAAWRADQGLSFEREATLALRQAGQVALDVTDGAVQVLGGHGFIREHPVELWFRHARTLGVLEGTASI